MTDGSSPAGSGGRTTAGLAFDDRGSGSPVILVHSAVADRRMWDPQVVALSAANRVIRYDARGFGESLPPLGPWSQHTDLLGLLDELLISRAHLVGASMGAGIAVEAALAPPDAVDPAVRAFVGRMQREAFELPEWDQETAPEHELRPPASVRLSEVACPILVVVGDADQPSIRSTAERIAAEAPDVRLVVWPGVAHMLSLERPDDFARLVLDFFADVEADPRHSAAPASAGVTERR